MNLVLLSSSDCGICVEAERKFKKKYAEELKSGEAEVYRLDQNEQAMEFWATHDLPVAPVMVVMTDSEKIIAVIEASDKSGNLEEEADPAAAEAVKAPG